jgi:hypothetical protein
MVTLSQYIFVFAACLVATLIMLFSVGLIGPKKLKDKIRRSVQWQWTKASLFLPVDPYKPAGEALKEGADNCFPAKERLRNFLTIEFGKVLLLLGIIAFLLVLYVISR